MGNSKKNKGDGRAPESDQGGQERPARFEQDPEFRDSWNDLDGAIRGRLLAKLKEFKRDWLKEDVTEADLAKKWDYKLLKGPEARKLKVMQITMLRDYRIALIVVRKGASYVLLLRIFLKSGRKNPRDIERATNAARRIREEEG